MREYGTITEGDRREQGKEYRNVGEDMNVCVQCKKKVRLNKISN